MITLSFVTHFDVSQRKLRIQDVSNYSGQGVSIANIKGVIKVTSPRGITYQNTNYLSPDITPASSLYSEYIQLPLNAQGYILAGSYSVQYSVLNTGDNSISSDINTYTYNFIVPQINITQTVDGYNSTFKSQDSTVYGTYTSLSRTHIVTPPSGSPLSITSSSSNIIQYSANIWSGIWTSQITSTVTWAMGDGLVIDGVLTKTQTITAYLNDMNVIRGYIENLKILYDSARATSKELSYRIQASLIKISVAYDEYDLALFYNDLLTAYLKTVDIINELSDYITITFPEEIVPFVNNTGGSSHPPVSIATLGFGVTVSGSQALSFALATNSSAGMMPQLSGNATDYLGGDGTWHSFTSGGYALKSDFAAYDSVRAVTAQNIADWQTAFSWGNHASAGYAIASNFYTKTNLQTNGQAQVHFNNIINKPSTLAEYGINDGVTSNVPVTPGTNTKITYDAKGLVIGGTTLSAFDIPSIPWSKITSGTPTTLAGYGITNAYTKTEVDAKTWPWSSLTAIPTTISGYGITDAYTKTEVDNKTWVFATSITSKPTTLSGYGITDALSTSSPAANVINSGAGNLFLADDNTYKTPLLAGVSDTQIVFIDGISSAGNANLTWNKTTNTLSALNASIGTNTITTRLNFVDGTMYILGNTGDLTFTDTHYSKTLSQLVSGATNFWTASSNNIYYYNTGTDKVGINTTTPAAELDVAGHIIANYFDSDYIRYKNSNILIGPNAGDSEAGSNRLYIDNTDRTDPIIYGELDNRLLTLNADVYIQSAKILNFGTATTRVYWSTGNNLTFQDAVANSGNAVKLTELIDGTYNSLKSDFTDYTAVKTITAGNKSTWNSKEPALGNPSVDGYVLSSTIAGVRSWVLGAGSGVIPTDNIFKWDGTPNFYYRAYSSKTEAGGVSSGGKFYSGTTDPTNTNRLNYDGYLVTYQFLSRNAGVGYGIRGDNTSSGDGVQGTSNSGVGVRGVSATGISGIFDNSVGNTSDIARFSLNSVTQASVSSAGINIITGAHYKINGVNLTATDVGAEPTLTKGNLTEATSSVLTITGGTGAIIGSGLTIQVKQSDITTSGYLSSSDWNTFNGKQAAGNYITSLTGEATASGPGAATVTLTNSAVIGKLITGYTAASGTITGADTILQSIQKLGYDKHVPATVTTTNGLSITGQQISLGAASSSTNGALTSIDWSTFNNKKPAQSVGLTFNPANPLFFDRDYQYNSYTVTSNITITANLTGAVALNSIYLTLVGDGTHTVSFSGIIQDPNSTTFDNSAGVINQVTLYYDGTTVYYDIPSIVQAEPYLESPTSNGFILSSTTADIRSWVDPLLVSVPSQTGNSGKFLTTNGTSTSWATVSAGVAPVDGIFHWDGTAYNPYITQAAGHFDNGGTLPQHNTALNYDGFFYATRIAANGYSGYSAAYFNNNTGGEGIIAIGGSKGISATSVSGIAGEFITNTSKGIYIESSGSTSTSSPIFEIYKKTGGTANSTGTIINIIDNPTSSGTITGSVLKATIGSTIRIDMNPRVVNSGTNKAYILDTHNTLSGTTELLSIQNNTVERFRVSSTTTDVASGSSTTFSTIGGIIKDFYTTVSSTGGENDLYTYTVPANVLANNGDKLIFKAILQPNPSALGATIKVYFAGTSITILSGTSLSSQSIFTTEIIRVSSSVCRIGISGIYNGAAQYIYSELTSKDWTTTNVLKITGQSSGQIDAVFGYIEYKPAGLN